MSRMERITDTVLAGIAAQHEVLAVLERIGLRIPVPLFLILARLAKTWDREIFAKTVMAGLLYTSNTSYGLQKLQRLGLVELETPVYDRRLTVVRITGRGREVIERVERLLDEAGRAGRAGRDMAA